MMGKLDAVVTDEETARLADAVAALVKRQRLVVVSPRVPALAWLLDFTREHGLDTPFLVLGDATGVPSGADFHRLHITGDSVDSWLRALEEQLVTPPAPLLEALDAYDPGRAAVVLAPPFGKGYETLLNRQCLGWRRPEWLRYEDKTISDSFWGRAGISTMPSMVADLTGPALRTAFEACDDGAGVVISADSSAGVHSGSRGVIRARSVDELPEAIEFLAGRCRRVRVAAFVEGMSCTVHGMVFDDHVAVFRPIEQVILRESGTRFPLLGGNAFWCPSPDDVEDMRRITRIVGEQLREEVAYRGCYGVDGILSADGFRPLEINARMGGFIVNGGPVKRIPLDLVHAMVMEGEHLDAQALEQIIIDGLGRVTETRLYCPTAEDAPAEPRTLSMRYTEDGYEPTDGEEVDLRMIHVRTPVGSSLGLEFPRRDRYEGVALGPFALRGLDAAARAWGLKLPPYAYAEVRR